MVTCLPLHKDSLGKYNKNRSQTEERKYRMGGIFFVGIEIPWVSRCVKIARKWLLDIAGRILLIIGEALVRGVDWSDDGRNVWVWKFAFVEIF
jgi:hypothetical protein